MKHIIYQILPRLWGNLESENIKNGRLEENGSGKFDLIDNQTLSYLKTLSVDYVWYTGVIRHATKTNAGGCSASSKQWVKGEAGSPYSITDWFDVNPYLAYNPEKRMKEFEDLVARTHEAGLRVIIDFVPNHVARDYGAFSPKPIVDGRDANGHPVFGAKDDNNVHWKAENDFFYYPGQELRLPVGTCEDKYYEYPAKASGNNYTPSPNVNDWYDTIKLNYCDFHTETWDKMLEVIKFWIEKGVDGFRCDMVELVPPEFFKWLIKEIKSYSPEICFIAEVYDKSKYYLYSKEVGFDLLYDKSGLYDILSDILHKNAANSNAPFEQWHSPERITWNWQTLGELQPYMLNFLENHDEQRLASAFFAKDVSQCKAALALSLLLNTASLLLYFGQEVGERGMDNEGFSTINGRTTIFDWWGVESINNLYKQIHGEGHLLTELQICTLDDYRYLLKLSKEPAFSIGNVYDLCYCNLNSVGFDKTKHFAFLRSYGNDSYLVVCNFSNKGCELEISIPQDAFRWMDLPQITAPISVSVLAFGYTVVKL